MRVRRQTIVTPRRRPRPGTLQNDGPEIAFEAFRHRFAIMGKPRSSFYGVKFAGLAAVNTDVHLRAEGCWEAGQAPATHSTDLGDIMVGGSIMCPGTLAKFQQCYSGDDSWDQADVSRGSGLLRLPQ